MDIQIIIAIAELCRVSADSTREAFSLARVSTLQSTSDFQLACQKEYLNCVMQEHEPKDPYRLAKCVLQKKANK